MSQAIYTLIICWLILNEITLITIFEATFAQQDFRSSNAPEARFE